MGMTPLPAFDHSRKWTFKSDHPPRRKIMYNDILEDPLSVKENRKHQMSRQSSLDENHKKSRQEEQDCMMIYDTSSQ